MKFGWTDFVPTSKNIALKKIKNKNKNKNKINKIENYLTEK